MFQFVYAVGEGESIADAASLTAFAGVETPSLASAALAPAADAPGADEIGLHVPFEQLDSVTHPPRYLRLMPPRATLPTATLGHRLREAAERWPTTQILIESGGAFATAPALWALMEAALNPRVKVAWQPEAQDSTASAAGSPGRENSPETSAAVIIATLNLRLGAVRLRRWDRQAMDICKRLAGIGFEGWMVLDPSDTPADTPADMPPGASRVAAAADLAAQIRQLIDPP
ncbi:MAG: hypothetical protein ACTHLZ_07630, partial [Tepidisphaeraceae bacterium]